MPLYLRECIVILHCSYQVSSGLVVGTALKRIDYRHIANGLKRYKHKVEPCPQHTCKLFANVGTDVL